MKHLRKAISLTLAIAAIITLLASPGFAVDTPKTQLVYMNGSDYGWIDIYVGNIPKGQSVKMSSVKVSNKKVLKPTSVSLYNSEHHYFQEYDDYYDYSSYINLQALKAGTCKVSYTIGKKSYSTTVTVKKYVNPVKSLVVPGVKSGKNLASAFNKNSYNEIDLKSNGKKGNIVLKPKSGWRVISLEYRNYSDGIFRSFSWGDSGTTKAVLPLPKALKKNTYCGIAATLRNVKDGGTISILYDINSPY